MILFFLCRQDEEVTEVSQQATPTLPSASPVGGVKRKRRRAQGHRSKVSRSGLCCLIPEPKYGNGTPLALNASSGIMRNGKSFEMIIAINRSLGGGGKADDWSVGEGVGSPNNCTETSGRQWSPQQKEVRLRKLAL